ncbi:hypothetical protein LOC54_03745 [Acetobacter sp. AN02]|uniref:hypothetical protein n=1 Tax=Acetobacter sp. AN02 TaxID=2894186 RepID=UPI0024344A8F|nr:hypothetical protein [Acetobacter sp. AN02]MDG6094234.1 hypothetical protein [Acetobacter sp. AN02]
MKISRALKCISLFLPVFLAILSTSMARADDGPEIWKIYANARFQYQICYPSTLIRPQGEPDNGDGQVFIGDHGAELRVFGRNRIDRMTIADNAMLASGQLTQSGGKVTYQVIRGNRAVISGTDGKNAVFYSKIIRNNDHYVIFELTYPKEQRAVYDRIASHLSGCLKADPG